jgi:Antibiotic biosynthesis monooxygenase
MPAFNIVRFRVKSGEQQRFIDLHRAMQPNFKGFLGGHLVKTGDNTFCVIGEWRNFDSIVAARPQMIGLLDSLRGLLEDLGGGLGVTDPVSGDSVLKLGAPRKVKRTAKAKRPGKRTGKKKK